MTWWVSRNHIPHTYFFDNRNCILVATCELQECLKSVHLGDLFFNFFQAFFKHDLCICDDLMTVSRNHSAHTYLFDNRNWILVATRELQECLKSIHLGDLFFNFFQALFKHDMCICDDLMIVSRNHSAHTYLFHHRIFFFGSHTWTAGMSEKHSFRWPFFFLRPYLMSVRQSQGTYLLIP